MRVGCNLASSTSLVFFIAISTFEGLGENASSKRRVPLRGDSGRSGHGTDEPQGDQNETQGARAVERECARAEDALIPADLAGKPALLSRELPGVALQCDEPVA